MLCSGMHLLDLIEVLVSIVLMLLQWSDCFVFLITKNIL